MSRTTANRPTSRRRHDKQADPPQPPAAVWRIVIRAALALVAGAVFVALLVRPSGMLGGILGAEFHALRVPATTGGHARRPPGPTWNDVFQEFSRAASPEPQWRRHSAVHNLMGLWSRAARGQPLSERERGAARNCLDADPDNLATRLLFAATADALSVQGGAGLSPAQRFESARGVIDTPKTSARTTLYNDWFLQRWRTTLFRYIRRSDAVANTTNFLRFGHLDPRYAEQHYTGLPLLAQWVTTLSDQLEAAGRPQDAARCRSWLARMLVGLVDSENDAETILLCADLLKHLPSAGSSGSDSPRNLRVDYHAAADRAPRDLCSAFRLPTPAPDGYRRAFTSLAAACGFFLCGAGGLLVPPVCFLSWPFARSRKSAEAHGPPPAQPAPQRLFRLWSAAYASLPTAAVLLAVMHIRRRGVFSADWAVACALFLPLVAISVSLALGAAASTNPVRLVSRLLARIPVVIAPGFVIALAAPPNILAGAVHRCADAVGAGWMLVPVGLFLISAIAAPWLCPLRAIVQSAIRGWCLHSALAVVLMIVHLMLDARYQRDFAAASADPVAARLGDDWKAAYVQPLVTLYDVAR